MQGRLSTFSYKRREYPTQTVDVRIVDCRNLPNPWSDPELRQLDGKDPRIIAFLWKHDVEQTNALINTGMELAQQGKHVYFGCYGGRHRSVAIAEMVRKLLEEQ